MVSASCPLIATTLTDYFRFYWLLTRLAVAFEETLQKLYKSNSLFLTDSAIGFGYQLNNQLLKAVLT